MTKNEIVNILILEFRPIVLNFVCVCIVITKFYVGRSKKELFDPNSTYYVSKAKQPKNCMLAFKSI